MTATDMMSRRPIVLVVEDNETGLRRRAGLLADAGCTPIPVRSRDDALRELQANPTVDLVLTDIHLVDRDGDRSGVELARSVKEVNSDLPVAGYSAYFSEESQLGVDAKLFNRTWIKGRMTRREIHRTIDECRELAIEYRSARVRRELERLEELRRDHEAAIPEEHLLRELAAGTTDPGAVGQAALREAGYALRLIGADGTGLERPIVAWVAPAAGLVELEVYGKPLLYADGPDDESAEANLMELMRLYKAELGEDPERLAGPALELKLFLDRVVERGAP